VGGAASRRTAIAPAASTTNPPAAALSELSGSSIGSVATAWASSSAPTAVPVAASYTPLAAAQTATPAAAATASPGSLNSLVTGFVDNSLSWLGGLPANPVTDFLSGALFLIRRQLQGPPTVVPPIKPTSPPIAQTFVVSTLDDSGPGSLRQAIIDANTSAGTDLITFNVAGVIRLGPTALPTVTDTTVIDGTTAPGFVGAPLVRVDFENTNGLTLAQGASGSQVMSLSFVDAASAGVTIAASNTIFTGDYIGVWEDGYTSEGNRGSGILIQAGASGNQIGLGSTTSFVLSNVISGNRGDGITITGADNNTVQASYVGTDSSGIIRIANRGNGIRITLGSRANFVGGDATGGNNPTSGVFVRPPQGNLVSGNQGDGILIDADSSDNQISGNFVGTSASGLSALGNQGDGVAIVNANRNRLVGTTALQDPFVFFNVLGGNQGNGLRISDSNDTIVWANFFGLGSDNATTVGNRGDGLLVDGASQRVILGGEIPLGNVLSGNDGFGIEVAGTTTGFISFNSFVGQAAFGLSPTPNRAGGIRITSSNPDFDPTDSTTWNIIRTSLIGGNWGNGIEFAGNAHGAEVTDTAVGTTYKINAPLPNLGNGIVIGGNSSEIAIGGFKPSVQQFDSDFSVHVGSNFGYGIVFKDNAHDNTVFNTRVGLGIGVPIGTAYQLPNKAGGVFVGPGTSNIRIGGPRDAAQGLRFSNEIAANSGNGITALFTDGLKLLGSTVAGNTGSGVALIGSLRSVIGSPTSGNVIRDNGDNGVFAFGQMDGSVIQSSNIGGNGESGVRLLGARGITIGGADATRVNDISGNQGWGILATGWSRGTTVSGNVTNNNSRGSVNTTFTLGLSTV